MKSLKAVVAILVVTAIAITAGVGLGIAGGEPQWKVALSARSEALNEKHQLGAYVRGRANTNSAWLRALIIRSDALNRQYSLGKYARRPSAAVAQPEWQRALILRSDALNRKHSLGKYASGS